MRRNTKTRFRNTIISVVVISSFISLSLFVTKEGSCSGYASFTYDPKYPDVGDEITFISAGSGYGESWNFGDGARGSGRIVTHTYVKKGNYTVNLRIEYREYEYDYNTQTWRWITYHDYASQYVNVGFPYPKFNYNPQKPIAWQNVTFDASESTDPVGKILYYNWSYIDTLNPNNVIQMGSGITLTYAWPRQGTYNVTVTETDNNSNVNGIIKTIVVSVLSVGEIATRKKNINIQIQNIGNLTAQDVTWNVRINKVLFSFWRKYTKSGTMESIAPGDSATIRISHYKRFFGFVRVTITVESDNAKITEVRYGFMFGRHIHLYPPKNR